MPPLDTRLIQVLGGTTIVIGSLRKQGKPFTIIVSRGRLLRSERFRRSVVDSRGVLANDLKWAIAIQGPDYENDVVAAFERDEKMKEEGWVVKHVSARLLYENPAKVRASIQQFVYS